MNRIDLGDLSKLELTGLPNECFAQNRLNFLEKIKKFKEINLDSILVLQGAKNTQLYDSDQSTYYFVQESNYYYLTGVREEGIYAIYDLKDASITLFHDEPNDEELIYNKIPTIVELSKKYQVKVKHLELMSEFIKIRSPTQIILLEGVNGNSNLPLKPADLKFEGQYDYLNNRIVHNDLYYNILQETRSIKTEYEKELMTFINEITVDGHLLLMSIIKPGLNERDLEMKFFNYFYKKYYNRIWAYPCIGGANTNSATLHYEVNDKILLDGSLFLADMGIRFCNYVSDVTMTIPINGKFTKKQKEIYDIVLKSNRETMNIVKHGVIYSDMDKLSKITILQELQKLGMIKSGFTVDELFSNEIHKLFMAHGLGHYMGLDVHDVGRVIKYRPEVVLEEGAVYTVEPGIYFVPFVFDNAFKDENKSKFLNVEMIKGYYDFGGVRIEDDVLVTKDGFINLTKRLPRTTEEIEDYMKKTNEFVLSS